MKDYKDYYIPFQEFIGNLEQMHTIYEKKKKILNERQNEILFKVGKLTSENIFCQPKCWL